MYKNGIQRTSFLPAIDLLKTQFDITDLDSGTGPSFAIFFACPLLISLSRVNPLDYRRVPRALSHAYFSPLDSATRTAIDAQFAVLTQGIPVQEGKTIRIWGRDLTVPRSAGHVAQFSFAELCGRPLGAADYLELTRRFRTLFVTDVPRMGLSEKDKVEWHQGLSPLCFTYSGLFLSQARRFITFIDGCYDSQTRLFVSSEVPIFEIFSDDSNTGPGVPASDHMRALMDDLVRTADSSVIYLSPTVFGYRAYQPRS